MNVSIRGLNDTLFKELKAEAAREGLSIGQAISLAVSGWLASKHSNKNKLRFLDLKPIDFGPGSEHSSEDIDKVLYGGDMPR